MAQQQEFPLPPNLPVPTDDGAARHLTGMNMPRIELPSTAGRAVNVGQLSSPRTAIYFYPMTGVPGKALPAGWDMIPGARGCTPQTCGFRDHHEELRERGAAVFGCSTQTTEYQREMVERLHVSFEVLSDADFKLQKALTLPVFEVDGVLLLKRLTLIIRANRIEHVFYPVFPPDKSASEVLQWLDAHPLTSGNP